MEEIHRQVLRENLTYLQNNLLTENVCDKLFQSGILTDDQFKQLEKESSPKKRTTTLVISILPKAGPTAFAEFIKAVSDDQPFIATRLSAEEQKVQQRLNEGNSYTVTNTVE